MATNREQRPRLYGRQAEREALAGLVDGVQRGDSAVLVVRGEAGTGKTALLDHAVGLAADLRVAQVTAAEPEAELAYSGLHQLCGPLLSQLGHLPGPQCDALRIVFGLATGPRPGRLLVGVGLLSLLAEAAAERPLVCVIDDAQWLDRASGQALAFAARRLAAQPVLMIFAARDRAEALAGLPELVLGGLRAADALDLLADMVRWPLDAQVREQIVAETRGNPRALGAQLRGLSPAQLAGGFRLPDVLPDGVPEALRRQLAGLAPQTRLLLRIAAADPTGDPALLWRATSQLGIPRQAALPAAEAGLVRFGPQVMFRDSVVRAAAYRSAPPQDRWRAHHALAQATPPDAPDRRAWHRSQAASGPDEGTAAELERTSGDAQARGGLAASAVFLERAAALTPDAARRSRRTLAAATAMLRAGEPDAAVKLLDVAETESLDDHEQARTDLVRARHSFAVNRGGDAPRLLLDAAQRLGQFDVAEARGAYLEAIGAALFATTLAAPGGSLADVAHAARAAVGADVPGPADPLLDGLAACFGEGGTAGAPMLRQALSGLGRGPAATAELHYLPAARIAALHLWDDQAWDALASRSVRLASEAGALSDLPLALSSLACLRLLAGDPVSAESLTQDARAVAETTGADLPPYAALKLAALRDRPEAALTLIGRAERDATLRGEGLGVAAAKWATAELCNGLGRYSEALSAAEDAIEYAGSAPMAGWLSAELVEAAARAGQPDRAAGAMRRLAEAAGAAGTDWALGVRARSLALLSDGEHAEALYRAAIEHLGRSLARVDLARAHLLYGEWLRREGRRANAREQLRLAHEMLTAAGSDKFAERARRELLATGETVRKRTVDTDRELTAQEMQVAVLARDGQTNTEIGAELFLSARTVEWHLRKVFAKLGITSRRQLQHKLPSATCCP